jgi:Zn-finger nucleic acid-binding protein
MMNRDDFPMCPRCDVALDANGARWVCKTCSGILLTEPEISRLVADMLGAAVSELGWTSRIAEPQPLKLAEREAEGQAPVCPRCAAAMAPRSLYGIKVDRCSEHGIWFDREELEQALRAASSVEKLRPGLGEKLFAGAIATAYIAAAVLQIIVGG